MAILDFGRRGSWLLALLVALVFLPAPAAAFGAGNIPSIAQVRRPSAAAREERERERQREREIEKER